MNEKLKKTIICLLPYLFVALAATCLGKAWRMAEDAGKAVESLAYFMKSVDETSGRAPSEAAKGGGLFERLGISDEGSSSSKGVEGMHPR